jgi:GntR family transcriptional regulator, rspAB operon transcriptional repressor
MPLERVARGRHPSSARAQAYARLREAIVSLRLRPGERIADAQLAQELGVSRTPVREAILQLADEGLVDVVPQHGTFVAPISLEAVREAQFVREALEVAALREVVERVTDAQLGELETSLAAQAEAESTHDTARFYTLDEAFHRRLMEISSFPGVWRIAARSRAHLNRVRILSLPGPEVIAELVAQHAALVERLRARDGAGAEAVLHEHLRMVYSHLPELERAHPEYFAVVPA